MHKALLALALTGCLSLTPRDVAFEAVTATTLVLDWRQTISITRGCNEANPIIGPCGERLSPNVYFPMVIVAHVAVLFLLNAEWRLAWQAGVTGAELNMIWSNHVDGVPVW